MDWNLPETKTTARSHWRRIFTEANSKTMTAKAAIGPAMKDGIGMAFPEGEVDRPF